MTRVFISYRREDSKYLSDRIYGRLADHFGRGSIFKDVHSIPLGSDFRRVVHEAVGGCDALLAVIGDRARGLPEQIWPLARHAPAARESIPRGRPQLLRRTLSLGLLLDNAAPGHETRYLSPLRDRHLVAPTGPARASTGTRRPSAGSRFERASGRRHPGGGFFTWVVSPRGGC
jgi:hypothetical protein